MVVCRRPRNVYKIAWFHLNRQSIPNNVANKCLRKKKLWHNINAWYYVWWSICIQCNSHLYFEIVNVDLNKSELKSLKYFEIETLNLSIRSPGFVCYFFFSISCIFPVQCKWIESFYVLKGTSHSRISAWERKMVLCIKNAI